MGLPTSRDVTLNPGDKFPSTLGNALQDMTIGHKHGPLVLALSGLGMITSTASFNYLSNGQIQVTSAGVIMMSIPLRVGDRITSCTFAALGNGTVDFTNISLSKIAADQTVTVLGTTTITNAPAAWTDTTFAIGPTVLAAGEVLVLAMTLNATGASVNNIRITYDRL